MAQSQDQGRENSYLRWSGSPTFNREIPAEEKRAIATFPLPTTIADLRNFLGLCGYHQKFIKGYVFIAEPLLSLSNQPKLMWNYELMDIFHKLRALIRDAPLLRFPTPTDRLRVFVEVTDRGYCGYIELCYIGQEFPWIPVSHFSKLWKSEEKKLSVAIRKNRALEMILCVFSPYTTEAPLTKITFV